MTLSYDGATASGYYVVPKGSEDAKALAAEATAYKDAVQNVPELSFLFCTIDLGTDPKNSNDVVFYVEDLPFPFGDDPQLAEVSEPGGSIIPAAMNGYAAVVGTDYPSKATPQHSGGAFRWTLKGGLAFLGSLPGGTFNDFPSSTAIGISDNSAVVVGTSGLTTTDGTLTQHAFRWTAALGMTDLGSLNGADGQSQATATDAAGDVVIGQSNGVSFRWNLTEPHTGKGKMVALGTLGGTATATAISADGKTIVGAATVGGETHLVEWKKDQKIPRDLGTMTGENFFSPTAVSANGAVIVGTALNGNTRNFYVPPSGPNIAANSVAFRWTQATGMQNLNTLMKEAGVSLHDNTLLTATTISPDGAFIGGTQVKKGAPTETLTGASLVRYMDGAVMTAKAASRLMQKYQ
ncbi:MAG TPA: hypothetical protein VGG10_18455 [Rhizomicrobium sp.]